MELTDDDRMLMEMDGIVGRCIREPEFGRRVLEDPATTLAEYGLNEDELDDFRALAKLGIDGVVSRWGIWHQIFVDPRTSASV